jgi:transposase-like protein
VRLVISDAHEGIKKALATVLTGATWQRCRVHFMRNLLAVVPKGAREAVAAVVRTVFAQPDHASALAQLRRVVEGLRPRFPEAATRLEEAAADVLAYFHFPAAHRRLLHSTNPLERLNKEIKRRTHVVGIFPMRSALLRLVGAILLEQDDEWAVADRRYFSAESRLLTTTSRPRLRLFGEVLASGTPRSPRLARKRASLLGASCMAPDKTSRSFASAFHRRSDT